jgi:hypothetical protein
MYATQGLEITEGEIRERGERERGRREIENCCIIMVTNN